MGDEDHIDEKCELRESKTSLVAGFIMPHNRIQIFKHAREIREQHFSRKLSCVKRRSNGGDGLAASAITLSCRTGTAPARIPTLLTTEANSLCPDRYLALTSTSSLRGRPCLVVFREPVLRTVSSVR